MRINGNLKIISVNNMKYLGYKIINQKTIKNTADVMTVADNANDEVMTTSDSVNENMTKKSNSSNRMLYGAVMVIAGVGLYVLSSGSSNNTLLQCYN